MKEDDQGWGQMRERIIGLGESSVRKSYYPELQRRLAELERAREELRVSESNLRAVFDGTSDAIIIHDRSGNVLETNESMRRLYRVGREEALQYTLMDYSAPELANKFAAVWKQVDDQDGVLLEWQARRPLDGSIFDIEVALRAMRWYERDVIIATVRDISERKRLEAMLRQSQKMDAIGQLAGGVAHDFNNMLAAILGCADLLLADLPQGTSRENASDIVVAATRAADLTHKLLTFSRKGMRVSTAVDVHEVLRSTMALLERSIDRKISVATSFQAKNPTVVGDPSQLQHAILNVCLNARDAMPGGGVLTLRTRDLVLEQDCQDVSFPLEAGSYVEIGISDTGTGMSAEVQARLFEPFFTTKEVGKGTGLGLAAVYGCLRDHHGAVRVHSEAGQGSVFTLLLPTTRQPASRIAAVQEKPRPGNGEYILVVDDEPTVRRLVVRMLTGLGYRVDAAANGVECVELYRGAQGKYQVVLMDAVMPRMSGKEALKVLRQIDPQARVVMCSGYSSDYNDVDYAAAGVSFVPKPYRRSDLASAIREALTR